MGQTEVCVFGALRRYMDQQGLPYRMDRTVPEEGMQAAQLARQIGLPLAEVEAVFRNGRVINIYDKVMPGDRVSFFPFGTPGPYRVFLGFMRENAIRRRREKQMDKEKHESS